MNEAETMQLLTEIRDAQRDLAAEYRRVANEALSIQRQSFEMQSGAVRQQSDAVKLAARNSVVYRVSLVVAAVLFAFVLSGIGGRLAWSW